MTVSAKHFMRRIKNIHFIGIGGVGMSGIAEVFHNLDYVISGSDIAESTMVKHLRGLGIKIHIGHQQENIDNVHVVAKNLLGERIGGLDASRVREGKRALGYALNWSELKVL